MKDDNTGNGISRHFTVVNDSDIECLLNNLGVPVLYNINMLRPRELDRLE